MSDRIPPHSVEAEQVVLGAILLRNEVFHWIDLEAEEFYHPAHRAIYEAMVELVINDHRPVDVITLCEAMRRLDTFKRIENGVAMLTDLAERVPTAENVGHYAQIVRDKATLRRLIRTSSEIGEAAFSADWRQASDVVEKAQQDLIAACNLRTQVVTAAAAAAAATKRCHTPDPNDAPIPTGLTELDGYIGGLRKRRLLIIGGRPGSGKSTLAQVIASNITARGVGVGWISLEEEQGDLMDAMIGRTGGLDAQKVANNTLTERELRAWDEAETEWRRRPFVICDRRNLGMRQIAQHARAMKARHKIAVLVLDYLGLIARLYKRAEHEELAAIIREFNALAQEIDVAPVLVCQINREFEKAQEHTTSHRPRMHQLQGAGAIEQCAWMVLLLYRACMHDPKADGNLCEIILAKNKRGPSGKKVDARWIPHLPSIENLPFDYFDGRPSKPAKGKRDGGVTQQNRLPYSDGPAQEDA